MLKMVHFCNEILSMLMGCRLAILICVHVLCVCPCIFQKICILMFGFFGINFIRLAQFPMIIHF